MRACPMSTQPSSWSMATWHSTSDTNFENAAAVKMRESVSSALQWTQGVANVNGVQLAWEQAGPAHGEPLLMVMGLSWQLIHWPDSLCADLVARGFRLLRFDNRDIGLSSSVDRGVRFDIMRDNVLMKLGRKVQANYTLHDMAEDTRA